MKLGVVCQSCGVEAPSRHVEFHQNIGALVMRFHKKVHGNLCKRCVHQQFWTTTGITLGVGWFGLISIILAPVFVVMNLVQYLSSLGMPAVPSGARAPQINEGVFSRFLHRADEIFLRVHDGESADDVARAIAPEIGITPGQVLKCMVTLVQHQDRQKRQREQDLAFAQAGPIFHEPTLASPQLPQTA